MPLLDDTVAINPVRTMQTAIAIAIVIFSTVLIPIRCSSPNLTGAPVGAPVAMGAPVIRREVLGRVAWRVAGRVVFMVL